MQTCKLGNTIKSSSKDLKKFLSNEAEVSLFTMTTMTQFELKLKLRLN